MTKPRLLALTLILSLTLLGCTEEGGGPVDPYPAPAFSLPDFNPRSATWNDNRDPTEETGKVLVLYFASFS